MSHPDSPWLRHHRQRWLRHDAHLGDLFQIKPSDTRVEGVRLRRGQR
jgi:hypothetical protein